MALLKYHSHAQAQRLLSGDLPPLVRVWTHQHPAAWAVALERGYLTGEHPYSLALTDDNEEFHTAYRWMQGEMAKRLPTYSGDLPVWGWLKRPSARVSAEEIGDTTIRLTALIPRERVLISDFDSWHMALNAGPLCWTEAESESFDDTDLAARHRSWERIFTVPPITPETRHWMRAGSTLALQACIDRIQLSEITNMRLIIGRRRS